MAIVYIADRGYTYRNQIKIKGDASMSKPTVSIHVKEDDMGKYIEQANKKFGSWEGRRQVSQGIWNRWGLSRSSSYVKLVTKGQIVKNTKEALDYFQSNRGNFGGFIIVPLAPMRAARQRKEELLGNE